MIKKNPVPALYISYQFYNGLKSIRAPEKSVLMIFGTLKDAFSVLQSVQM